MSGVDLDIERTVDRLPWVTSSYSTGGACVQVLLGDPVLVRHSKQPDGPVLAYSRREWDAFLAGAKANEFG